MIQTVKILYIPTGEFLKRYTPEYEIAVFDILCENLEATINRILLVNKGKFPQWARLNNIQFPLVKEELEVMYEK